MLAEVHLVRNGRVVRVGGEVASLRDFRKASVKRDPITQ